MFSFILIIIFSNGNKKLPISSLLKVFVVEFEKK